MFTQEKMQKAVEEIKSGRSIPFTLKSIYNRGWWCGYWYGVVLCTVWSLVIPRVFGR